MLTAKEELQKEIREKYQTRIEDNLETLCQNCVSYYYHCTFGLLPVTSEGKDCPYFRQRSQTPAKTG